MGGGKVLRLKRLIDPGDGRTVILPMDHGVSCGPIPGLQQMEQAVRVGTSGGADALVLHKGMVRYLEPLSERIPGLWLHLSASTQLGPAFHDKVLVGTAEEAIRRGADGISVHVNLGAGQEPEMLGSLGRIGASCEKWQLPLLVMIYVRGPHAPSPVPDSALAHAARVAAELGADLIKIPAPKDWNSLARITSGSPVPVVIAGGGKTGDTIEFLTRIERALGAGAGGVAIGRNVFQHARPIKFLKTITAMVHGGISADEAAARLTSAESNPSRDSG